MTAPAAPVALATRNGAPGAARPGTGSSDPALARWSSWPWLVLGLLLVVHPATPGYARSMAPGYLIGVALLVATSLGLRRLVVPRAPTAAAVAVLVSGLVAIFVGSQRFPLEPMLLTFATGLAHAALWLTALALLPGPDDGAARSRSTRRRLTAILLGVIAVQGLAVLGVVEGLQVVGAGSPRALGSLGNPNLLGATVGAAALALAAFDRWRRRTLLLLPLVLPILLATQSRGAVAALLAVLVVLGLRRRALPTLVAVGVALALLTVIPNPLRDRVQHLDDDHAFSRPMLWSTAVATVADTPLGIGPGNYRHAFPVRAPVAGRPWLVHQRHAVGLTHNVFLTLFAEWGLLAGGAALLLTLWAARRLLARGPPDPLRQGASLGAGVLFAEMQVDGLEQNALGFALFLLLLAAALKRCAVPDRRPGAIWPAALRAALVVGLIALVGWRQWSLSATADLRDAVASYVSADAGDVGAATDDARAEVEVITELLARAQGRNPISPEIPVLAFKFHEAQLARLDLATGAGRAQATIVDAVAALERARALSPSDPTLPGLLARFWIRLGRGRGDPRSFDLYQQAMSEVLRLDPLSVEARLDLAQECWRAGQPARARRLFDALFAIEPDHPGAWWMLGRFEEAEGRHAAALYAYVRSEEAVHNARLGLGVSHPRTQAFYEKALEGVDLNAVRRRIHVLRRELYL